MCLISRGSPLLAFPHAHTGAQANLYPPLMACQTAHCAQGISLSPQGKVQISSGSQLTRQTTVCSLMTADCQQMCARQHEANPAHSKTQSSPQQPLVPLSGAPITEQNTAQSSRSSTAHATPARSLCQALDHSTACSAATPPPVLSTSTQQCYRAAALTTCCRRTLPTMHRRRKHCRRQRAGKSLRRSRHAQHLSWTQGRSWQCKLAMRPGCQRARSCRQRCYAGHKCGCSRCSFCGLGNEFCMGSLFKFAYAEKMSIWPSTLTDQSYHAVHATSATFVFAACGSCYERIRRKVCRSMLGSEMQRWQTHLARTPACCSTSSRSSWRKRLSSKRRACCAAVVCNAPH